MAVGIIYWKKHSYENTCIAQTNAIVISVEPKFDYVQTEHEGQKKILRGYHVNYQFEIGGSLILGADFIPNKIKFNKLLTRLRLAECTEIEVLYDPGDETKSYIKK